MKKEIKVNVDSKLFQDAIDAVIAEANKEMTSNRPVFFKVDEISGEVGGIVGRPQLHLKILIEDKP